MSSLTLRKVASLRPLLAPAALEAWVYLDCTPRIGAMFNPESAGQKGEIA
jgi:hypothetical protein